MPKINFTPFDSEFSQADGINFTPFSEMGEEEEVEEEVIEQPEQRVTPGMEARTAMQKDPDLTESQKVALFGDDDLDPILPRQRKRDGKPKREGSDLLRFTGQMSMRGLESIIGLPRGAGEAAEMLVPEKALIRGAEEVGLGEGAEFTLDTFKKYAPYKIFPTEDQARKFTKSLFGDLFEPKNELEEKLGVAYSEFISLVMPFLGQVKPMRAFLMSAGANAAKETGEQLGLSDEKSNLLKFGTYVVGALFHPKWAERFYEKTYAAADKILPQNAKVSSTQLSSSFDELEKGFRKSGISSADAPALKQLENLKEEIQGDLIPVDSLVTWKKKFNIARGDIFKQLEGNKSGMKTANKNMEMVGNAVDETIELYSKQNPTWGKFNREANNAFAAVQTSKRASKFLKGKWPKLAIGHTGLSALLGHFMGLKALGISGAVGAAAVPGYIAVQTLNKIMRSPALRKEYFTILQESARGNWPVVSKSVKALDKGLQSSEK